MKNLLIFSLFCALIFAKSNINLADRYELMKYGELDAGRADMLILYREKHEISDKDDLQKISGFNGFDTKKLEQNFIIAPLPKEEPKPKKEEPKVTERIIEKTIYKDRYPLYPRRYENVRRYGNIEITDTFHDIYNDGYYSDEINLNNGSFKRKILKQNSKNRHEIIQNEEIYQNSDGLKFEINGGLKYQKSN
jgi:hypothetical protein